MDVREHPQKALHWFAGNYNNRFSAAVLFSGILLAALFLASCSSFFHKPAASGVSVATNPVNQQISYIVANPNSTPTATPFQPSPPTPTYLPDNHQDPDGKDSDESDDDESGSVVPTLHTSSDQVTIMLLGSDQRPFDGGFRTDTMILVILKPSEGTASMVSFPRDLYVRIPYHDENRLNTAMVYGGFPLLNETLRLNFGIYVQHYVMVNFWAFVQIIDDLGGIDVHAASPLTDHREGYGQYTVPAGTIHMDGETALWYARSRYSSSDFDRTRRQQEVIRAIFERLLSLNAVERAPQIYDTYSQNVTTDLTLGDITPLIPLALQLTDNSKITNYYIGPSLVTPWTTPGGAQVLLPNSYGIHNLLREAFYNP